jgi:glyoxylase-like metal-dependent hydrolase (beta-lactamase superfamily II)
MIIKGLTVGLLQENCYIVGCEETREGVIIDPGDNDNARAILKVVRQEGLTITKILNTHAHLDHVMAVDPIRAATGALFYLHRDELPVLHDVPERASLWLDSDIEPIDDPLLDMWSLFTMNHA